MWLLAVLAVLVMSVLLVVLVVLLLSWPCVSWSSTWLDEAGADKEQGQNTKEARGGWFDEDGINEEGSWTRRLPTRSYGWAQQSMRVVHCWFASISKFYFQINCLNETVVRWNTVTRDKNAHVNHQNSVFLLSTSAWYFGDSHEYFFCHKSIVSCGRLKFFSILVIHMSHLVLLLPQEYCVMWTAEILLFWWFTWVLLLSRVFMFPLFWPCSLCTRRR